MNLTVHHIHQQKDGGPTDYGNLILLCHNCHVRVDETRTLPVKDIRRLKRHLVKRFFTRPGANALKLAVKNSAGTTIAPPYDVEHLVELGFLEFQDSIDDGFYHGDTPLNPLAIYRITDAGRTIAKQWLERSDD
jgi:hypothetical protein